MKKTTGHKEDVVNNPSHYKGSKGLEVMEVLENFLTPEELKGFYKGNVIKYILRSDKKNGTEFSVLLFNQGGDVTSKTFFKSKEEAEQFAEATGGVVCLK